MLSFQRQGYANILKYKKLWIEIFVREELELQIYRKKSTAHFSSILNENENQKEQFICIPQGKCMAILFKSHIVDINLLTLQ